MESISLQDGWTVAATGGPVPEGIGRTAVPAAVPGCVHTDLIDAGLIPDPYLDANETSLRWAYGVDWQYRRTLTLAPAAADERVDLVFGGIDTVSRIRLGGVSIGETANMHRSYRFDVRELADGVERELVVDLFSATTYAERMVEQLGARPGANTATAAPFTFVRKMACSFGWDWGPDLRTAGLWKPVRVERWRVARFAQVRPLVGVRPDGTGQVEVHVDLERSGRGADRDVEVVATVAGVQASATVPAGRSAAVVVVAVPDAEIWWPVGYGAQPLSALEVRLLDGDVELDRYERRIGFRNVELDTSDDEFGTAFTLKVNGRPVFVRGANWIPDDHFLTRLTRERVGRRMDQALGAHLNLLRVWGGGVYESEDFYELADERGLLVWQDFLLACGAYAEESPLAEEIEAEARENVARLTPHPSLVLWNGGNENLWAHEDWGWVEALKGRSWGERYARELFPAIVAELDPTRPYSDNSPSSPRRRPDEVHPNDPDHGSHHQWEVWNREDYSLYRTEIPRFCSEFGFQGPPTWRTLADFVHAADGGPLESAPSPKDDPVFLVHQKAEHGNAKLDLGMARHLGIPTDFTDWLWAGQLNQARAVAYAIEHYRSWWPRTAGAIVWQLNDCWPVTSWAAVDSLERPKPLWYALRRAFAPRLLTVVERDGAAAVAVVNDTDDTWHGDLRVRLESLAGEQVSVQVVPVDAAARGVTLVPLHASLNPTSPTAQVLVVELDGLRTVHTFVEDIDLALDPEALEADARAVPGGYEVRLRARSLVRDATALVDRLDPDARADEALLTLPAGAEATIRVTSAQALDVAALTSRPVLRSANDLRGARIAAAVRSGGFR